MVKATDVMTRAVATCAPDTTLAQVAVTMRDHNIGDVLVMSDGELRGIVTDRDLSLRGLTSDEDPRDMPIKKVMTPHVISGQPDWSLDKVANVMARHQVRRLPIVQDGAVVGILSLGDVALHSTKKGKVAESLEAISESSRGRRNSRAAWQMLATSVALAATTTAVVGFLTKTNSGATLQKKIAQSSLAGGALAAVDQATKNVRDLEPRKAVLELVAPLRNQLIDLADRLGDLQPQPKRKRFWLV
jgi:CBS domain-containing protein